MRADQLLVQRGLAPTRSAAQRLIERGAVRWLAPKGWAVPKKAGEDLPEGCEIEITDDAELRWVSRGGLKLDAALTHVRLDVAGRHAWTSARAPAASPTCCCSAAPPSVVGVDVGHGQLHPKLRGDARVTAIEGVNARHLDGRLRCRARRST